MFLQAFYFDRDDVALSGLHKYFKKASDEEREHAMKFMKYQNKRGGRVTLSDIKAPKIEWGSAQDAMQAALDLEADVNEVRLASFMSTIYGIIFYLEKKTFLTEPVTNSTTCIGKE